MPLDQFCKSSHQLKQGGSGNRTPSLNRELNYTIGKVIIPSFDGSSQMSANAWLQKLSPYFQLNPMVDKDALKMAIFHLEG